MFCLMKRCLLLIIFHTSVRELHETMILCLSWDIVTLLQMKQINYSIIYPYISYAILISMGSAYKTHIDKIKTKQNHSARLIFFPTTYGGHTESALPLPDLINVLTVHNAYRFHILKFTYLWHKGLLPTLFFKLFSIF